MKTITKTIGFINGKIVKNPKIKYVNTGNLYRDDVLEEVRKAMWKKAHKLYSIGIDYQDIRKEDLKALTLVGKDIDKFIDKLKTKD